MFTWIRSWFKKRVPATPIVSSDDTAPKKVISPDNVEHDDPMAREVIARCFNTGKMVIGNRREDGTVEIKEIDKK